MVSSGKLVVPLRLLEQAEGVRLRAWVRVSISDCMVRIWSLRAASAFRAAISAEFGILDLARFEACRMESDRALHSLLCRRAGFRKVEFRVTEFVWLVELCCSGCDLALGVCRGETNGLLTLLAMGLSRRRLSGCGDAIVLMFP